MPLEVVSKMRKRLQAVARRRSGQRLVDVAEWAGVHPATVRRWVVGYEADGTEALEERSRRPARSPNRLPSGLEDLIVELRHDESLCRFGVPGAGVIREQLRRRGMRVPARSTVHSVLVRRGEITPTRQVVKPPPLRFEAPRPNERWQLDGFSWALAEGVTVEVVDVLDDHARKVMAMRAVAVVDGDAALAVFGDAAARFGAPAATLTDNAGYFTGRSTGTVSAFERALWDLGVATRHGSPRHPQTQGKIERFHRTVKSYLRRLPPARTLAELGTQLERFIDDYNHRPHAGIGYATPDERYAATEPAAAGRAAQGRETTRTVWEAGNIRYSRWVINIGRAHQGRQVTVTDDGSKIIVGGEDGTLLASFAADTPKGYVSRR